jgi:hypothetical protein
MKYLTLTLLLMVSFAAKAQQNLAVNYRLDGRLNIFELEIKKDFQANVLFARLAEKPEVIELNGSKFGLFNSYGVAVQVLNRAVKEFRITFNPEAGEAFSKTVFNGTLFLGDFQVTKEAKREDFKKIKGLPFVCSTAEQCILENAKGDISVTASFKEGSLSSIVFGVKD